MQSQLKHEALGHEVYKMLVELTKETYVANIKNSETK